MSDDNRDVDVTKEWRATHDQKSAATRLRIFAALGSVTLVAATCRQWEI